jgi:hypothetical protein
MLKRLLSLFIPFVFSTLFVNAQLKCAADEMREKAAQADPNYKRSILEMDKDLLKYIQAHQPSANANILTPIYYIPCVVHVIHTGTAIGSTDNPTDAQITGAIDYINQVYDGTWTGAGGSILGAGDLQVKFILATKDPSNAVTAGIERINGTAGLGAAYTNFGANANGSSGIAEINVKGLSRWDPYKYYNIWTVNKIDGCTGTFCGCACDAGFIAGYAYFPVSSSSSSGTRDLDGTIMLASQFVSGQKTLPHELGHALNLYHPFQGNDPGSTGANTCPVNTVPATDGDQCTDTDPITNPQLAPNAVPFACRTGATNPCISPTLFNISTEQNFMNYTNCYRLFTNDQKARMQASCASTMRASLSSSWANNQGTYPTTFAAPAAASVTPTSSLTAANVAGIYSITLNGRSIYSLNASQDGGYVNGSGKWYQLFDLQKSTLYNVTVVLQGSNDEQMGVWLDYDGNGTFNNTNEQLYRSTHILKATAAAGISFSFTTPASWTSTIVRLRITEDLSNTTFGVPQISNASASLTYGQAEDYPVFLNNGPLPVTLVSFTGNKSGSGINLSWKTSQEINTNYFQVERSLNGRDFIALGNLAAGNPNGATYSFTDASIGSGNFSYRLKIIDRDGAYTYSRVINFTITGLLQVTSNPFTDKITVLLPKTTGNAQFRLLDASGRVVYKQTQALNSATAVTIYLKDKGISPGVYILEAMINNERYTQKLVKQ